MEQFIMRHKKSTKGVLSGFDRVLFRGTIRSISYLNGMEIFLSSHKILLKDFKDFVLNCSRKIQRHGEEFAQRYNRPYQYIQSSNESKEKIAKEILVRDDLKEGLICVLSCVEPCQSYSIRKDKATQYLHLISSTRKCLHFYFYFLDKEFGFMHVRLQTWFPCSIQVCINGREWLARKMDKTGISYKRKENCFVDIENLKKAQKLSDSAVNRNWHKTLDRYSNLFNPLISSSSGLSLRGYYWTVRECEYATDVIFKNESSLAKVYPSFIRHAMDNFSSENVMRFLGRRSNSRFNGEVTTDIKKRPEGIRIKHWVEENSIKMYDKQGSVLRIETTINNPRRFKVYRDAFRRGRRVKAWIPMRKGIADIYRRVELCRAANYRYLEALSVIGDKEPSHQLFDPICSPVNKNNRRFRSLRPVAPDEARLFKSVMHGEFLIRGFRNSDIRPILFPNSNCDHQKKRDRGKVTRLMSLLRAHRLIKKVSRTRLYRVTNKGQRIMATSLNFRSCNISLLEKCA
jgi:hypothetical protein